MLFFPSFPNVLFISQKIYLISWVCIYLFIYIIATSMETSYSLWLKSEFSFLPEFRTTVFLRIVYIFRIVIVKDILLLNPYNKVNCSRYGPGVAQRVGRGIALLFHDRGTRREWVVSSTPRPHCTPGINPVPILQEAGWAPGPVLRGGKYRPHRDSIPDRPARSSVAIPTELPGPLWTYC